MNRLLPLVAALTVLFALATAVAFGHVERSSYWPAPAPDTSVRPAAGGEAPKARGLAAALRRRARGDTYGGLGRAGATRLNERDRGERRSTEEGEEEGRVLDLVDHLLHRIDKRAVVGRGQGRHDGDRGE